MNIDHIRLEIEQIIDGYVSNTLESRALLCSELSSYLMGLRLQGTDLQHFTVVCDETNNTPATVENEELHVKVVLAFTSGKVATLKICVENIRESVDSLTLDEIQW